MRGRCHPFLSILFTLCCWFPLDDVVGQVISGTLRGLITNEKNELLLGANVLLIGTRFGGVSDGEGLFEITKIPPGKYDLRISMVGYETRLIEGISINAGKKTELNIRLSETAIEMDAIEVTGSLLRQTQDDAQTSLHFLQPHSAKHLPGFAEDVLQSLQALPGLLAPNDYSAQMIIRGSGLDENLIVMDDIEIFNRHRLYGLVSMFNCGKVIFELDRGGVENLNTAQLPAYHRLDLCLTAYTSFWGTDWSFYLDMINAYNHANILRYRHFVRDAATIGVRETTMLPFLPTIGFSARF